MLRGGTGEDTFIIIPRDVSDDGDLLDGSGNPVAPTVVVDFNPDADRLVLDLRQFDLRDTGTAENPAILTGVPGSGDGGVLIRVNGIDVVQLSSYGGGDAEYGLIALATKFDALEVIGAVYAFPPAEQPEGITVETEPGTGAITFIVTDDFTRGSAALEGGDGYDTLDLSQISREVTVSVDEDGSFLFSDPSAAGDILDFLDVTNVERVILGSFGISFNGSAATVPLHVES